MSAFVIITAYICLCFMIKQPTFCDHRELAIYSQVPQKSLWLQIFCNKTFTEQMQFQTSSQECQNTEVATPTECQCMRSTVMIY